MNEKNLSMNYGRYKKELVSVVAVVGCLLAFTSIPTQAAGTPLDQPPMSTSVVIEALDKQPVPDDFKNMARKEIDQMSTQGHVDVPDDAIGQIENAEKNADGALKPWAEIRSKLKISPASVQGKQFDDAGLKVLGAATGGTLTAEGWTAVSRLFVAPGVGVSMLEEIDYVASGGGLMMIKEVINEDVNGHPAILRIKK